MADMTNKELEDAKDVLVAKGIKLARKTGAWTQKDTDALNELHTQVNAYAARLFFLTTYDKAGG